MPCGVALIAVRAVIDIARHTLVLLVGLRLAVTNRAGKHRVVRWIRVAVAARTCPSVLNGEPGVVEHSSLPGIRGMAGLASGGESGSPVVRVRGVVVILLVTGITIRRNVYVVVVHMALVAGHGRVRTGEGELSLTMIERCGNPRSSVVTHFALLRKSYLRMVGVVGVLEIRQVTGNTSCVRQLVISIDVTLRTSQCGMGAGQQKAGSVMVELCARPG